MNGDVLITAMPISHRGQGTILDGLVAEKDETMKFVTALPWLALAFSLGCDQRHIQNDEKQNNDPKEKSAVRESVKPATLRVSHWQDVECRVFDQARNEFLDKIHGERIAFFSGPREPLNRDYKMNVVAFGRKGNHSQENWIGLESDLYLARKDGITGMKVFGAAFVWFKNFATTESSQQLSEAMANFEQNVPGDRLFEAYRKVYLSHSPDEGEGAATQFDSVIPKQFIEYLFHDAPGSSTLRSPQFVSAAMDGDLLKVTISSPGGQVRPSIWLDVDTLKAVKAADYEFDPKQKTKHEPQSP